MKTMHENVKGSINISHRAIAKIASSVIQTIREVTALVDGRNKRTDKKSSIRLLEYVSKNLDS